MSDWRLNNFDLIRLGAALQVAIGHTASHFGLWDALGPVGTVVAVFPGVPIFFVVSGLLISRSYEQSARLADYFRNRCLRIFPALWICLAASVLGTALLLPGQLGSATPLHWLAWWAAQMSVAQFWQPSFLRGLGTHALNGSLWTITIELQFYLALPLLYGLLRLRTARGNAPLLACGGASLVLYVLVTTRHDLFPTWNSFALTAFALAPYLWIFIIGMLIQRNFERLRGLFAGKLVAWLALYTGVTFFAHLAGWRIAGNAMNPVSLVVLAGVVASAAFTLPALGEALLRRNDLSYGLYIYHAPLLNLLLAWAVWKTLALPLLILLALACAAASWWLIEKPFQRQKRHALRDLAAPGHAPLPPPIQVQSARDHHDGSRHANDIAVPK
jgi:peptidoglycan/LPS O-acetylase OafA/YrhL